MSDVLQDLSNALAGAVETVGTSTVRVDGRRRLNATGIVWSADGVIVTANHVVERDENLSVTLHDGSSHPATLVGRDQSTDVAVLRVTGATLTVPKWIEPADIKVGHMVLAVGRNGNSLQATLGVVSAFESAARMPTGLQLDHYLQTDVVMYPGFSGGPLVGVSGGVLGLNSSGLLQGVSLAVPVPTLKRVVETLLKHGKMRRGFLGVGVQPVRLPEALSKQETQETGLMVMSVESNGPGDGKLYQGDTLLAVNGKAVRNAEDLIAALTGDMIGKPVTVKIARGGQVHDVSVTIGERA